MAYLDALARGQSNTSGNSVSALAFPLYEQTTPQYPSPNPYELAKNGYQRNELVYACINKWMKAIAEAPLCVYDNRDETPKELPDHPLRKLLKKPNPYMSEKAFWRGVQMWLKIAGFSAWEIEFNNLNEPMALWPMSPHWCSFRRGPQKPIAWVDYRPWGLELQPVPIERVLLFQYMDPVSPFVRALSPSAVSARVGAVDNNATDFMKLFWEHGAVVNGLLTTEQPLQEAEARLYRKMWGEQHGGFQNWTDPAVLGQGIKYQQTQMDFRQMTFGDLDARDETRICQAFAMQPILVSAKVGLDRSTFSNYGEARKAQYEEEYMPEWDWLEAEVQNRLLPLYEDAIDAESYVLDFDISQVHALQEDRTGKFTRAGNAFEKNIMTRDEAREEMDLDPVDNAPVFSSDLKPAAPPMVPGVKPTAATDPNAPKENDLAATALSDAQTAEVKRFLAFAANRKREGSPERIVDFKFKFLPRAEQKRLVEEALDSEASDSPFDPSSGSGRSSKASDYGSDAHKAAMALFDKRTAPHIEAVRKVVEKLFKKQSKALAGKAATSSKAGGKDIGGPEDWQQEFIDAITPVLTEVVGDAAALSIADYALGISFDLLDPRVTEFIEASAQRFATEVNATTWDELKKALKEGTDDGESIDKLAERIAKVMGDRIASSAETIARTEVIGAFNGGTWESWKQSGVVKGKQYLSTFDKRTRRPPESEFDHLAPHGQIVGLDEPFIVSGEELMYPGDRNGSAGNIINCRCTMTAVLE